MPNDHNQLGSPRRARRPRILLVARAFIKRPDDNKLLFARRSLTDPRHPGLWECPGGKVDPGEHPDTALAREIHEETGFVIEILMRSFHIAEYPIQDGKYKGFQYQAHFSMATSIGGTLLLSHEHSESLWLERAAALELELTPEVRAATLALEHVLK